MARYAGVTQWQVRQVWQAADVTPHRLKTFTLSHDPQFAEQVIDVGVACRQCRIGVGCPGATDPP